MIGVTGPGLDIMRYLCIWLDHRVRSRGSTREKRIVFAQTLYLERTAWSPDTVMVGAITKTSRKHKLVFESKWQDSASLIEVLMSSSKAAVLEDVGTSECVTCFVQEYSYKHYLISIARRDYANSTIVAPFSVNCVRRSLRKSSSAVSLNLVYLSCITACMAAAFFD